MDPIQSYSRRAFLGSAGVLLTAARGLRASSLFATAETTAGKVQGMVLGGINTFKGIPYGASTAGPNRFQPPRKPAPWKGVRDAFEYGQVSPQALADSRGDYLQLIDWYAQPGGMGEDCLMLNIWTPGLRDGVKRPVLVSFHGGGWASGSGAALGYDGDPLARFGNVVVVTVNHRLSSFGYLDLGSLGAPPEFALAGVAGMMDLAASLEWIRDNIESFGGDPKTVMIFGQSGGGAKTSALMAMPSAKGLFHRAAVQSGSQLKLMSRETAAGRAGRLLTHLGLDKTRIAEVQKFSWEQILDAQIAVAGTGLGNGFEPVVDGAVIPRHPFDPTAPEVSADVPMIVSTTLDEASLLLTDFDLDEAGLQAAAKDLLGANAGRALALYRKAYPDAPPYLIRARALTDRGFRSDSYKQAERKAALGKAPAYMYLFTWPSPGFGGKFGAVHGVDVPLVFHSYRGSICGGSAEARVLADQMAAAWVAFAKTGNPNDKALPPWPPYDAQTRATMIFGKQTRVENDPGRELRLLWEELAKPAGPA